MGTDEPLSGLGVIVLMLVLALAFVLVLVNIYIMVKWQHPDDANEWVSAKIVVVLGMTIAELIVMGLPLDVNNGSGSLGCSYDWGDDAGCSRLDMETYWAVVFFLALVWMLVAIPLCIFAYEASNETDRSGSARAAWCEAAKAELAMLTIFGVVVGCMFGLLNQFVIAYDEYRGDSSNATVRAYNASIGLGVMEAMGDIDEEEQGLGSTSSRASAARLPATFFTYATALTTWIGWFFFSIWGGVGLAALPLDLILSYVQRPIPLGAAEVAEYKIQLQARTEELIDIGRDLQKQRAEFVNTKRGSWLQTSRRNASDRVKLNKLKQMVHILETEIDDFVLCSTNREHYEPLVYVGYLLLGIIALIHSVLWVIHTILFVVIQPPVSPFLNEYLLQFERWYPIFAVLACVTFTVYLLFATITGAFKFGMRVFLIDLHPMKYNGTYMNHMLFNVSLFLLCSFPVAQFTTIAFSQYAQFSDAANVFFVIEHLTFFRAFFENLVFVYVLLGVFGLSTVYLLFSPRDIPASADKLKASLNRVRENLPLNPPGTSRHPAHNAL